MHKGQTGRGNTHETEMQTWRTDRKTDTAGNAKADKVKHKQKWLGNGCWDYAAKSTLLIKFRVLQVKGDCVLCHNPWPGNPSMISGLWWCIMTSKSQDSRPRVSTEQYAFLEQGGQIIILLVSHSKEDKIKSHSISAPCCLNLLFEFSQILPGQQLRDARYESLLLRLRHVIFYSAVNV